MSNRGGPDSPTAQRLRLLRAAMGYRTQQPFADFLKLSHKQYANFENGYPISRMAMDKIVEKVPGVYDWLMSGREDTLNGVILSKLREASERAATAVR